jgi:ATP-dependent 26S proteasome regulatory subunit
MRNYLPGIIFLEDIESVGGGEKRDGKMNDLLNTLDGVETKGAQLLTIFTTNHEKRINKALRRPGRIDIIVSFAFCTEDTIQKIMQAKFKGVQGADSLDYEYLSKVCPKVQGAVIAAICDRALDLAEYTNGGEITNEIVESSKVSMQYQIDFMAEDPEIIESPAERVYGTLMQGIRDNIADLI